MAFERQKHAVCFVNCNIYAIGGYHFGDNVWLNTIESISLPSRPEIDYMYNYDTIAMFEQPESNQNEMSPRDQWLVYNDKLKHSRSNMSVVCQLERYIYVFCGKHGEPDSLQPSIINVDSLHSIERFDCLEEKWEEYVIKSCHKINKMFSPGTIPVASLKRKNPGILFFGGKAQFKSKKMIKKYDSVFLMFPQNNNKSRQLEEKYFIKGKEFKVKALTQDTSQKKNTKEQEKVVKIDFFNGDTECIRKLCMYTEDPYYYYFLGCRDKCEKLESKLVSEPKETLDIFEKCFGKHVDPHIESTINKDENIKVLYPRMFGMEGLKLSNFDHPRHGHTVFMLDKSTLKWTSMPVVKYVPSQSYF